jgi:hypothetical protein
MLLQLAITLFEHLQHDPRFIYGPLVIQYIYIYTYLFPFVCTQLLASNPPHSFMFFYVRRDYKLQGHRSAINTYPPAHITSL